jgi:molybdopterin/thiamine biosynthesis adenylyltransferase/rhodanese-related sulfurtransferase
MPKSYADLLREAREQVREVSALEAESARAADPQTVLLDVREELEWEAGHAVGALHVSKSYLEQDIEGAIPDRDRPIVIYCAGGIRSLFAGQILQELGYTNVASMAGGFQSWKAQGLDWDVPRILSDAQKRRYSRHLLIPEVGLEGQGKLLDAKVLLVGAGGLGSPAALYLAAAGVGMIGIVDFDVVDVSNLQRQILHTADRVGTQKVESARQTINALNPEVTVVGHEEMLVADNVDRIIDGYDVILDGTDTFETRYLLNDAAVAKGIPVVHASVFRFEGQLTVFKPFEGPCYRCLYPTPPPPELAPGCSVAGVLGVVPGIMGMLQANEALKLILGIGDSLAGRLLLFDALDASFTELKLKRDPACPVCSDAAIAAREAGRPMETAAVGPAATGTTETFVLGGGFGAASGLAYDPEAEA